MARTREVPNQPTEQGEYSELDNFGLTIAAKRREAIDGRRQLGIEEEWLEDEEAYLGVDDANRHEFRANWYRTKPDATTGQFDSQARKQNRSTAFINITRPYVDAAAARTADMLLPASDDRGWSFEPTPMPELDAQIEDELAAEKMLELRDPLTGVVSKMSEADWAQAIKDEAAERSEKAQTRIDDWLKEARYHQHVRQCIEDAARIGTCVLKGPIPKRRRIVNWSQQAGAAGVEFAKRIEHDIRPRSRRIDAWNFFPDPNCGEDIQNGGYVFERDSITPKRLLALRDQPGYIPEQIDACLREGPIEAEIDWNPTEEIRQGTSEKPNYELWHYHGLVSRRDMNTALEQANRVGPDDQTDVDQLYAIVTMVNHRVVKVAVEPLNDETFPYDVMVWQRRVGTWVGRGVGRQMRTEQRGLNAAVRQLMDNSGLSAGPQVIIDSRLIKPADGVWELAPRKVWLRADGEGGDFAQQADLSKAFLFVTAETRQAELLNIIQFFLRMAEESTGLPMILQGQMGEKNKTDKVGVAEILNNNGSTVLRRIAKHFDEQITEPHIQRYYEWLMEYGPDTDEKGDFQIVTHGSSTLVERDLQNFELIQLVQLAADPVYGLDPQKTAEEYLKSRRFDPQRFKPTEQELAAAAAQPPPPDPNVVKEEIKAADNQAEREHETAEAEAQRAHDAQQNLLDKNIETARFNAEADLKVSEGSGI